LSREIQEHVQAALEPLSPQERAAFVLRHYEGLSTAEIGRLLGLSIGASKHSVFRAVRKVRKALEPLLDR
jgi:RNA polymerase sigma-70 factor (ECF subfamily)